MDFKNFMVNLLPSPLIKIFANPYVAAATAVAGSIISPEQLSNLVKKFIGVIDGTTIFTFCL